jgi:hypothetical protein
MASNSKTLNPKPCLDCKFFVFISVMSEFFCLTLTLKTGVVGACVGGLVGDRLLPPIWGPMKHLSERIPREALSKARIFRDIYNEEE